MIVHRIMGVVFASVVLLQATLGVACLLRPELVDLLYFNRALTRLVFICCGTITWLIAIAYVLTPVKNRKNKSYLSLTNKDGTVSIATSAISDYISRLRAEFPSIEEMRPEVIPARNAMNVRVRLKVKAGAQVSEMSKVLCDRIRETIGSGLGIEQVGKVDVVVDDIVMEHMPA